MNDYKLGEIERRFADIVWDNEPLSSGQLTQLCAQRLDLKKSTTYTVMRKLCGKGLFQNQGGQVTSLVSRQQFLALQSEKFVEDAFGGSLPKFLTAFSTQKKLSPEEIQEIQKIIENNRGD